MVKKKKTKPPNKAKSRTKPKQDSVGMSHSALSACSRTAFALKHVRHQICQSIFEWAPFTSHVESEVGGDKGQLTQA